MTNNTQARAPLRALVGAAVIGSLASLALGASYMGGSLANAMTVKAKAERLETAASDRFSDEALISAAGGLDASALSIARRHDPYTVAGGAFRDRDATAMAARLERETEKRRDAGLRKAAFSTATTAAQPFRLAGGALDASRDLDCLAQAVYYEARGEGVAGMRAVAQVVLNRVRHPAFPKTVCGVVYQGAAKRTGCQFSFTCDGSMRRGKEPGAWRRAQDIASKAIAGYVFADVGNATHFHTLGVSPRWRTQLMRVAQVGTHIFYRFGGRGGSSEAFRYTPRPSGPMEVRPVYASIVPTGPSEGSAPAPYKILFEGKGGPAPDAQPVEPASAPVAAAPAPATAKPAETAKPVAPKVEEAKPLPAPPKTTAPTEAPAL